MRASLAPSSILAGNKVKTVINMTGKGTGKASEKVTIVKEAKKRSSSTPNEAPSQAKRGRGKATPKPVVEERIDSEDEANYYGGDLLFNPNELDLTSNSEDEGQPNFRTRAVIVTTPTPESPTQLDESFIDEDEVDGVEDEGEEEGDAEGDDGEADQEEEEDLNRVLPELWDHPTDIMLDRLDLYADEVAQMVKVVNKAKLIQALFSMSCSIVFDFVSAQMGTMSVIDLATTTSCTDAFKAPMDSFPKKAYAREKLLHLFPNSTWPAAYVSFVKSQLRVKPTAKAIASNTYNGVVPAQYCSVRFGLALKTRSKATKAFVNMNLLPNYVPEEKLPSGHTKEQLLRAIRGSLWAVEAQNKAQSAMRAAASRRKRNHQPEPTAEAVDAAFVLARSKAFCKFNDKYYPQEFLVFLLFSAPAEQPAEILASLNAGNPGIDAHMDPTATAAELGSDDEDGVPRGGRDARRARLVAAANGGRGAGRGQAV